MDKSKTAGARVKVCHVAMGDLWAGAEVHLLALLTYLVRSEKIDCSVIVFNEGRLAEELRKFSLSVMVISENIHTPLTITYRLAQIFKRVRPDIVHTHKYKDSILATIAARCAGIPHVVRVVHGMPEPFKGMSSLSMSLYTLVDRFVLGWLVDKIIAVSSDIERVLVRIYGAGRVVRIHNGIDLEVVQVTTARCDKRKEWHFAETATLVGTVGRLVPVKGHTVLLEALQILQKSNHTVQLLIVGDGPLRGYLEDEVRQRGLEKVVMFAGHQVASYDFINMMDVFVLPSLHEGIPMVLLEALALQRPVVATRVGGIPEVIEHERTGLLAEPSDASSLAKLIQRMIEDQPLAVSIGNAGRARVEAEFTARTMAKKTAELYEQVLRKGSSTAIIPG